MWVKISKPEDTKKLKVGDKVRVDGTEYKCTHTYYSPTDYGFDIDGRLPHGSSTMGCPRVVSFDYTIELWEENQMLERDKEYDIKLTGEELFLFTFMLGQSNSSLGGVTYEKLKKMFIPEFESLVNSISTLKTINLNSHKSEIIGIMDKVFTKPETEQEKKIREMEEQYAALGRAIEEVKKGSK